MKCPYCGREIKILDYEPESGVIRKEKEIWRPWDVPYPNGSKSRDSTTWSDVNITSPDWEITY